LRAHRLVTERREGRRVFYKLSNPALSICYSLAWRSLRKMLNHRK